ncbi:hypothetical protein [Sinomonas sp. ASV322]|uniref:ParB family protein n=1 Tax=Sinomonas sp. ASV322 TaxID=3041920 RepID=UPI0027DBB6AC|nr:hypothetical protein [Sinomonas sp. ASV322]MDQ4504416.1 hypothetical protein [Sinomonas sp. ASV322]
MSARPAPRRSSLAGSSPIAPPAAPQPVAEPPTPTAAASEPADPGRQSARAKTKYPPKTSFYQEPEDTDRMRAALLHTLVTEGSRSLSKFINDAVMAEVERLERKYNHGKPFPPVKARELPQGRPMGE